MLFSAGRNFMDFSKPLCGPTMMLSQALSSLVLGYPETERFLT
jgi:hypothetical protein